MWIGTAGLSFTAVPRVSFLYLNYPNYMYPRLTRPGAHERFVFTEGWLCMCLCLCVCVCVCGCDEWCDAAALLGISSGRRIFKA